ncbi:MAG: hypothetical protein ACOX2F_06255 [bacterium]
MKKTGAILFFLVFTFISCKEVNFLQDEYLIESEIVSVKVEPPVAVKGEVVSIYVAADDGSGGEVVIDVTVGNTVFAGKTTTKFTVPKELSSLFGDEVAGNFKRNGFVDVTVEATIRESTKKAVKMLRIAGSDDQKASNFAENPVISKVEYEVIGSAQKIEIENGSVVSFDPSAIPEEVRFTPEKAVVDEILKDEYVFSWFIAGSSGDLPLVTEFDKKSGEIVVLFRDFAGAPLVGKYKFFSVLKPAKAATSPSEAHYGSDFVTFVINTTEK